MKVIVAVLLWIMAAFFGLAAITLIFSEGPSAGAILFSCLACAFFATGAMRMRDKSKPKKAKKSSTANLTVKLNETDQLACAAFANGPEAVLRAIEQSPEVRDAEDRQAAREQAVIHAIPALVNHALEDSILTEEEEKTIEDIFKLANVSPESVPLPSLQKMTKASIVRDLLNGKVDPRLSALDVPFFNLQKTEIPVWVWPDVTVLQNKTVSEWVGRSQGVSVRIASGLYWRTSGSRGHKVTRDVQETLGTGHLLVTSRHVYFQGGNVAFRIRLDKIVSMQMYSDGVEVYQEGTGAASKPKTFLTDDAWFLINCLSNAQNWQ